MEEKKQLMCLNVEDAGFNYEGVDGSTKARCNGCKQPVWISPSGSAMVERGDAEILCTRCLEKAMAEEKPDDPIQFMPPQPEQLLELAEQLVTDAERKKNGVDLRGETTEQMRQFYLKVFGVDVGR